MTHPRADQTTIRGNKHMTKKRPTTASLIRNLRLELGLSQTDLAAASGICRPNISRLESGKHTPTLGTLRRVATALGVTVKELLP